MPWAAPVTIATLSLSRMPYSGIAREVSTRLKRVVPANAGTHIPEPVVMGPRLRGDDNQEFSAVRTCDRETSRRGRDRWAAVGSLARRMGCRADCPTARRLLGRGGIVVAEPDTGDEVAGIADEPGVAEILAGAGLAGGLPAWKLRLLRGADQQRLAHHRIHHGHMARLDDAAEVRRRAREQNLAGARAHALDHMRQDGVAAIRERRVGAGELDERDLRRAERQGRIGVELGGNAEAIG